MHLKSMIFFTVIMYTTIMFSGCLSNTLKSNSINTQIGMLPMGAEVIMNYGNGWVKWRFENQCFLSMFSTISIAPYMMSTVACPEMQKLGPVQ